MPSLSQSRFFDPKLFLRISNMQLIARLVVEGMMTGRHQSPYHGFSVEFSEYRKYSPGDDPRHIDWKVLAKSDKIYIRKYEAETNLKAYLLIDASGSMGYGRKGGLSKLEYTGFAAAALAYLMIHQQDAVGLVAFDSDIRSFLAPRSSPIHLTAILRVLEAMEPAEESNISQAFHNLAERVSRRGLIIVFSDLLDDPEKVVAGLAHFRHKKHEVILFHVIDPDEQDFPFQDFVEFEDMETNARLPVHARLMARRYRERFRAFTQDLHRRCAEHAIEYVPMRTDRPVELALLEYLGKRSRIG